MSEIILDDIIERIQELAVRAEKGSMNDAYILAWQIGMKADIEDSLKKLKVTDNI